MTAGVSNGTRAAGGAGAARVSIAGIASRSGDNMNDIDLLETAGHPFMMDNANPGPGGCAPCRDVPRIGSVMPDSGVARQFAPN